MISINEFLSIRLNPNAKYPASLCDDNDILVRRFYLYDIVTGIQESVSSNGGLGVLRYASYISLDSLLNQPKGNSKCLSFVNIFFSKIHSDD